MLFAVQIALSRGAISLSSLVLLYWCRCLCLTRGVGKGGGGQGGHVPPPRNIHDEFFLGVFGYQDV